ncbi:hypothetical protein ET445_16895 [Agromyces protaetiae]|uniref:Rhodanese domain-containing protein n=1 Tax=Agromyces protaetiae TaxID=2509455 RepID=A0A4P6FF44_9MICO|nr:ThiF family adenylyltransferase [Agromyces protaetiae]QAY74762.1 hypothetical protein ET445_16895 [Agromyces protaetiae]
MALPPLVEPADALPPREQARVDRQLRLPELGELGQRRLRAARVCVVGAGGLGAPALLSLAAAGVGTIGIVDDDVVELSNLHRQPVHGVADVGRPKVVSAAETIAAIAPDTAIRTHEVRIDRSNASEILAEYDLVLDGTDTFETRYLIGDVCDELGIPLVWASVLRFDAQLSVFWSRPTGGDPVRLRDLFPEPPAPGEVPSCAEAGVMGALCTQVGAMMASEAIKLIAGIGEPLLGRVLVIDSLTARQREIPLKRADVSSGALPVVRAVSEASGRTPAPEPAPAPLPDIERVDPAALADLLAARTAGAARFALVDVREPGEFAAGAIDGAVLLPLGEVLRDPDAALASLEALAGTEVVVHCHFEARAERAAIALARAGVESGVRVRVLAGGFVDWPGPVRVGAAPVADGHAPRATA